MPEPFWKSWHVRWKPDPRPWHKVLPLPLLPMTMAGPFLTPKHHQSNIKKGRLLGVMATLYVTPLANTTCFLWFCQEMNKRSLHLHVKAMNQEILCYKEKQNTSLRLRVFSMTAASRLDTRRANLYGKRFGLWFAREAYLWRKGFRF